MSERKEIVLPYDLYHRIRISSEEHGGIGAGDMFTDGNMGEPLCAHGHAWGTCTRFRDAPDYDEPQLRQYIRPELNDRVVTNELMRTLGQGFHERARISFSRWCELLNVKCGQKQGEGVDQPTQALGTLGRVATPEPAGAF